MPPLSRMTALFRAMSPDSRNLGSFHWITSLVPADQAFIKNLHIAIAIFVENAIGQTGQVMWAGSIENNWPVSWNTLHVFFELSQRGRDGAEDMNFVVFRRGSHIDNQRLFAGFHVSDELID